MKIPRAVAALALAALTITVACGGGDRELAGPSPTPPNSQSATATPTVSLPTHAVVYAFQNDLWLYDVKADSNRRLTNDGPTTDETSPRFRDGDTVTFLASFKVMEIDLSSGRAAQLIGTEDPVAAFDWSPDGETLALLTAEPAVALFTPADGRTETIRSLHECPDCGRGGGDDDETRIEWSPDGSDLLVVNTGIDDHVGNTPTMWAMNVEGRDLITPRDGTHARWTAGSNAIIYEPWNYTLGLEEAARLVDIRTGKTSTLPISSVYRPAPSPDGRFITYDDGRANADVFVYDVEARTTRRLARGAVGALWLSADSLAVTKVRPCEGDECGHAPPWFSLGAVERVTLGGAASSIAMRGSIDADVLTP